MKKQWYDMLAFWLVIIGALNWGLAIWNVNLVTMLLGSIPVLVKIVYGLVGLSALWLLYKEYM